MFTRSHFPRAMLATAWLPSGAVLLALAACGKSEAPAPPGQVAARVNKAEISVHQLNALLQHQPPPKPEQAETVTRQALERLIDQELAIEKAKALKLDRTPRVMQAIDAARNDIIARAYAEQLASTIAKPTPAEIQAYYDSNPQLFKERRVYSLQQLQVQASPEQLPALGSKVQEAKSVREITDYLQSAKLPVRVSQDTAGAESLPPALLERFAKMTPGQAMYSTVPGGARIIVMASAETVPASFEQARQLIEQKLFNERRYEVVSSGMKALRDASKIEYLGSFAAYAASGPVQEARSPSAAMPAEATASSPGQDAQMFNKGLGLK